MWLSKDSGDSSFVGTGDSPEMIPAVIIVEINRDDRREPKNSSRAPGDHRESERSFRNRSPDCGPNIVGVVNTIEGGPTGGDS